MKKPGDPIWYLHTPRAGADRVQTRVPGTLIALRPTLATVRVRLQGHRERSIQVARSNVIARRLEAWHA